MSDDIPDIDWFDLYSKLEGENHEEVSYSMLCQPNSTLYQQNQQYTNTIPPCEPPPTGPYIPNPIEGGGGSSSWQQPPMQAPMIDPCYLINPFGIPYSPQMVPPTIPANFSFGASEYTNLVPTYVNFDGQDGKKRKLVERFEDDETKRRQEKKIKNRASASKFRQQKLERTKKLEEKVEKLRKENAVLRGNIMLQKVTETEEYKKQVKDAKRGLRRTLSSLY